MREVKYYVYFDHYRTPKRAVSEITLAEQYNNDPDEFLRAMCNLASDAEIEKAIGHVGVMRFAGEKELRDYCESTGEEIIGFYECREDSRPYNF
jgi:hypothetical protein